MSITTFPLFPLGVATDATVLCCPGCGADDELSFVGARRLTPIADEAIETEGADADATQPIPVWGDDGPIERPRPTGKGVLPPPGERETVEGIDANQPFAICVDVWCGHCDLERAVAVRFEAGELRVGWLTVLTK